MAEGFDVLSTINEAYCDKDGRPFQDIRIYHTVILDDPFPDPDGMVVRERSPSPPKEVKDSNRIGAEEDIDEFKVSPTLTLTHTHTHTHSLSHSR